MIYIYLFDMIFFSPFAFDVISSMITALFCFFDKK